MNEVEVSVKKPRSRKSVEQQPPLSVQDLIGVRDFTKKFNNWWAKSFVVIAAVVLGYFVGSFNAQGRILDDCKINSVFRIGEQSFTCMRKM